MMAVSGRKFETSIENAIAVSSTDDDEISCQPCASDGEWLMAAGYCTNCNEHLCRNCLKTHQKLAVSRKHVVLAGNNMPRKKESTGSDLYTELCRIHHGETVKFYCIKHNQVGCSECMVLIHTSCKNQIIKDVSKKFATGESLKRVKQTLKDFKTDIEKLKETLIASTETVDEAYSKLEQQIKFFREDINRYLDNMEEDIMEEAKRIKAEQEKNLTELKEGHEALRKRIEDISERIESNSDQVNSLFVVAKYAEEEFADIRDKINKLKEIKLPKQSKFNKAEKMKLLDSVIIPPEGNDPNSMEELQYLEKICIKSKRNKTDCDITDCLVIDEERLAITDWASSTVKLIHMNDNSHNACCSLNHSPWSLTAVHANQIATTIPDEQRIQLISINKNLSKNGGVKVNGACRGISYKDGKFAVSYVQPVKIEILNTKGMLLHTLSGPTRNLDLFQNPLYIKFGMEHNVVFVSDFEGHKITKLNFSGQIVSLYSSSMLKHPQGLVITEDNKILVCSKGTDSLHEIEDNLQTAKVITDNNMVRPYTISYSGTNSKIYIYCENDKNHMLVYQKM